MNETTHKLEHAKCMYCLKVLVYNVANGISVMCKHLIYCKRKLKNIDKSKNFSQPTEP